MEEKFVERPAYAASHFGLGFWTAICVAFAGIFGVESKRLNNKTTHTVSRCFKSLNAWTKKHEELEIRDIRLEKAGYSNIIAMSGTVTPKSDKKHKVCFGSANIGLGLWTAICLCFASFFGVESKRFTRKQNDVLSVAKKRMLFQPHDGYKMIYTRVVLLAPLNAVVMGEFEEE